MPSFMARNSEFITSFTCCLSFACIGARDSVHKLIAIYSGSPMQIWVPIDSLLSLKFLVLCKYIIGQDIRFNLFVNLRPSIRTGRLKLPHDSFFPSFLNSRLTEFVASVQTHREGDFRQTNMTDVLRSLDSEGHYFSKLNFHSV